MKSAELLYQSGCFGKKHPGQLGLWSAHLHDFCACARLSCELMATNGQEAEKAQEMFTHLSQIEGSTLSTWGNSDTWQKNLISVLRIFEFFRKYCPAMVLLLPVPWIELACQNIDRRGQGEGCEGNLYPHYC